MNHFTSIQKRLKASFDVSFDEVILNDKKAYLIFLTSLTSQTAISRLIQGLTASASMDPFVIFNGSISVLKSEEEAIVQILSGQCILLFEEDLNYYSIETRSYPTRSIHAPENEKSIRGSGDAFVENIIFNVALIRRRIKDERLTIALHKEGNMTKTDLAIVYMKGIVNQEVVDDFYQRLKKNQKVEIYSDRNLIEALYGKTYNPYPHVRYSERPDICAIHLLQGYMIVLVDNVPAAMILPTTYFEQLQQVEEYTQTPIISFFTRIIRLLGIFISVYLMPFWIVVTVTQNPTMLNLPVMDIKPFEFGFQILFSEVVIEWIRQSLIHSPDMLTSIMGFLVVFVLGDFGIEMGAYTKEILIMVALTNLGNLLTPSYEIALANKLVRVSLSLLSLFWGMKGFAIGIMLHFLLLMNTKTIKYPYLYPLIPFSLKEMKRIFIDTSIYSKK